MTTYDAVVVGGGAAGLAGAVALGRARRTVLVVDAGEQRNLPAEGVHNFLTRDGMPPAELAAAGRKEAESYGVHVVAGRVEAAEPDGDAFRVTLDDGTVIGAARLLLATGVTDELPPIPGLAGRWGRDLLHCPYCHGWEVRDRALGILSTGPFAVEQALLWRQWSADVTLFLHTGPEPTDEQYAQLAARGIAVVDGEITGIATEDDRLIGVRLGDRVIARDALVAATTMHATLAGLEGLGLVLEDLQRDGVTIGTFLKADPTGKTDVPGVYAAGNLTMPPGQVIAAAAAGTMAGAMINFDLVARDTRAAVEASAAGGDRNVASGHRHDVEGAMDDELARTWDERYREDDKIWSGEPNVALVKEVTDLTPGRVLDLGCGEGGDAVWFARQGWTVTAADISQVALERAARHATDAGVADRIDFQRHNFAVSFPDGEFDLVSAQFLHSWGDMPREEILRRAAAAVAPGGVLLIEGHSGTPHWEDAPEHQHQEPHGHGEQHGHGEHPLPSPDEVIASLNLPEDEWEVLVVDEHARTRTFPDGRTIHHVDNTVKMRRRVPSNG
ncbi:bifunctional NAD(P)/FAD-dependent oxidoreductase/class I SAM-dependent methyltransferase [Cryptosporangium arvum]|uniref:bifunctional NAD(P)/FAD-dependent oxidoreductase/class I SAM-dependent methyltransferase n=1 Tax=Cryptosporangium arvum TaxID=80871 RepID=UPI0005649AA6|nr:bifunctional NAD(P)/FAD-dependent oxidoreductase/class I SAM-dependent methyltransferase [Cryptosporangium arvum]